MKQLDVLTIMDRLRNKGWLVMLKVIPREASYIIEGSRSEYDAPCPDREVNKGQWACEASDMSWAISNAPTYRRPVFSFGKTAQEAVSKLLINIQRDEDWRNRNREKVKEAK